MATLPTHVNGYIEGIKVGNVDYPINAALLEGHSWSDISELAAASFEAVVYTTLPTVPTSSQSAKDEFYKDHQSELALVSNSSAEAGSYLEYILVKKWNFS